MDSETEIPETTEIPVVLEVPEIICRHEFVRIYQRKLKGLERRMVATKAYLPVGFKATDFSHLGEGSYCFCRDCRVRLFPKRTNAEKAQARIANALNKQQELEAAELALDDNIDESLDIKPTAAAIAVEELEIEAADLDELDTASVEESDDEESL